MRQRQREQESESVRDGNIERVSEGASVCQ